MFLGQKNVQNVDILAWRFSHILDSKKDQNKLCFGLFYLLLMYRLQRSSLTLVPKLVNIIEEILE